MLKITITGPQGAGKSTLGQLVKEALERLNFTVSDDGSLGGGNPQLNALVHVETATDEIIGIDVTDVEAVEYAFDPANPAEEFKDEIRDIVCVAVTDMICGGGGDGDAIDTLGMVVAQDIVNRWPDPMKGALDGVLYTGPDGHAYWAQGADELPGDCLDVRPATVMEKNIMQRFGSTAGLSAARINHKYHDDAMRTAAGPEVFHTDHAGFDLSEFIHDLSAFAMVGARLDRWKGILFYGKDKPLNDAGHRIASLLENTALGSDVYNLNPQLVHAILGIASEGGELVEDLLGLAGGVDTLENIVREQGDVDWFQELLAEAIDHPVVMSRVANIERLRVRFPDKFSEEAAVMRADESPDPLAGQ